MSPESLNNGAVAEQCDPYAATDNLDTHSCNIGSGKAIPESCTRYFIKPYNCASKAFVKRIKGEEAIQHEIMTEGPVYGSLDVEDTLFSYKGGVYKPKGSTSRGSHALTV